MKTPLLICNQVSKSYRQGSARVPALRQVSLRIGEGEFVALTGPSGSGKSTLLNICGLLDQPDNGELLLAGRPCHGERERVKRRRDEIGFVFQNFGLIPVMSAFENIEYPLLLSGMPAARRKERVERMLDAVGIADFSHHLPDALSGGQRQRVAIARALVKEPPLVIADEPTANLDTATAESMVALMKSLCHGMGVTFLIATHDERMSAHCDRIERIIDGVLS